MAIASPLLEASIDGARGVLLMLAGGSDLGLFEVNEAADVVTEAAHPEANIIFGAVIDDSLGDEVKVTVIAAGFDKFEGTVEQPGAFLRTAPEPQASPDGGSQSGPAAGAAPPSIVDDDDEDEVFTPPSRRNVIEITDDHADEDDELDVPSFLR